MARVHQLRSRIQESATRLVTHHGVKSGIAGGIRMRDDPIRSNHAQPGATAGIATHARSSHLRRGSRRDGGRVSWTYEDLIHAGKRAGPGVRPGAARAQSQEPRRRAQRIHRSSGVLQRRWTGHPEYIWSVTKSVLALAVGAALDAGCLTSLDQTLGDLLGPTLVTDPCRAGRGHCSVRSAARGHSALRTAIGSTRAARRAGR